MKVEKREELKEKFIEMYLGGKTMQEISELTDCSRNFIGRVIKDDERVKRYRNQKKVKVFKYKKQHKMNIPISVSFLEKIGISSDLEINDFVDVEVDEKNQTITIKKHNQ